MKRDFNARYFHIWKYLALLKSKDYIDWLLKIMPRIQFPNLVIKMLRLF